MSTTELITSGNAGRFAIPSEADLQAFYGVANDVLAEMKTRLIVPDMNTPDGYKLAVAGIRECRELRGKVEQKRVELKEAPLEYGRKIDKVAKFLTAEIESIEAPIKAAKKEVDDRLERERLEAERKANEERLAAERERREQEERKLAEERATIEADRKAMEADLRRQRDALEAEQRRFAEQQAEEARKLAEERAVVEAARRRQEEAERQRLAESERKRQEAERAERAQQEAAEREARRLAALPEAEKLKAWLMRIRDAVESGPDTSELVVFLHDYNDCYHSIHNRQAAFREHIDAVTKGGAE